MIRLVTILLLSAGLLAGALYYEYQRRLQVPLSVPEQGYVLQVAAGDSLRGVIGELQGEGIVPYPRVALIYGRVSGMDAQIKQGEYRLPPSLTMHGLLELLKSGRVIQYQVTLPEGITLARAIELIGEAEGIARELQGPADARLAALVEPQRHVEGLFFPDTYQFTRGETDWAVLQRAHRQMLDILQEEWRARADDLPYETPYEALIMASIVERETGVPSERAEIAGVFVRRLKKGMRLQTDPTVIYGLGHEFDGNLRRRHLKDDANPYNTYRHRGLPPSPIALPGRAAIHAALHPAQGDTLYFVARGDGSHQFSATLAEHEAAVRKYQLVRPQNYRSSPQ